MICFGWFQILTNMKMYDQINFGYLSIYLKFFLRKYHVHKYKTHHVGSQKPYFSCNNHLHLEYSSIGKTETDGNNLRLSSSGSRNSGSISIWSSNPGTVFKMKIQIQHSWIFHFPGFKIFWIQENVNHSHFLEWIFHWRKFESRNISIQTSFNSRKCEFKKVWNPRKFQFRKMKNSGMLDLNLDFETWNWIWT